MASFEQAVEDGVKGRITGAEDPGKLKGDLDLPPDPLRRLWDQEVYALDWAMPYAGFEAPILRSIIADRMAQLDSELSHADRWLNTVLHHEFSPQFRSRPDTQTGKIAVEQWIPAMRCWLTNGLFSPDITTDEIVDTLHKGDPNRHTAEAELADRRLQSEKRKLAIDEASSNRVKAAVDSLGNRGVQQFIEVERALHTGENITMRGDDGRQMDLMFDKTRTAAAAGDLDAQRVLTEGVRDGLQCLTPENNPLLHKHKA